MDHTNLLCDELWLSPQPATHHNNNNIMIYTSSSATKQQEHLDAEFCCTCLDKEQLYLPRHGFLDHLRSRKTLIFYRFRAIQWLIKSCTRFNLSSVVLFNAANYLDRFISIKTCHEWKNWMVELLSVACLSVASKLIETSLPSLLEIQMEAGLDHIFEPITIQQMEMILLKTLQWRLNSTTAYSFFELILMTMKLDDHFFPSSHLMDSFVHRVNQLLLQTILDYEMVEYRPSVAAATAMWCGVEELIPSQSQAYLTRITGLINQIHKDEIVKCRKILLEMKLVDPVYHCCRENSDKCPSSPVTVLLKGSGIDGHDDLSIFNIQEPDSNIRSNTKKRRRMEDAQ